MSNDSLSNILLLCLIGLLGFLGKIFYKKIEEFGRKVEKMFINDAKRESDITNIKKDIDNHEVRITKLEN